MRLLEQGNQVVVVDDLSTGNAGATLVQDDMVAAAASLLGDGSFDGVLHFAAKSSTGAATSSRHSNCLR